MLTSFEIVVLKIVIVEIETSYKAEDLQYIKRSQAGDFLTLTHPNYPAKNLVRNSHYSWTLKNIVFEPTIKAPTNVKASWTGATDKTTRTYQYLVTAVNGDNNEESKRSNIASVTAHREANWLTTEYMTITWSAVSGATEYNFYRSVNGIFGYIGTAEGTTFTDDNIEPDLSSSAPIQQLFPITIGNAFSKP